MLEISAKINFEMPKLVFANKLFAKVNFKVPEQVLANQLFAKVDFEVLKPFWQMNYLPKSILKVDLEKTLSKA